MSDQIRDEEVAVPGFTPEVRGQVLNLLSSPRRAEAMRRNQARHPEVSGVTLTEIRQTLDNYVEWEAIWKAMEAQGTVDPEEPPPAGDPRNEALIAEAIHQFQQRCFIDAEEWDGRAGEHTLDSLGLTRHRLPDSVDIANPRAQEILNDLDEDIRKATQGEFSAAKWFDHMISPSFLGRTVKNGIHMLLARKLRHAEKYLLSLPAYQGLPPAALGRALGIREEHKGARPTKTQGKSMHLFGLALDVNYTGNPWVSGARDVSIVANEEFIAAVQRASWLIAGEALNFTPKYLSGLAPEPTPQIYQLIFIKSQNLCQYLGFVLDPEGLWQTLARPDRPPGVVTPSESREQAVHRWQKIISQDLENLQREDSSFAGRDPAKGFLDLHADLVTALREHARLAWGAVDIGPRESGDMMHFDDRREGVGKLIRNHQ